MTCIFMCLHAYVRKHSYKQYATEMVEIELLIFKCGKNLHAQAQLCIGLTDSNNVKVQFQQSFTI